MTTLERRTYRIVCEGDNHDLGEFVEAYAGESENPLLDTRDAGFLYGLALGLALAESPGQARERAYEAAEETWRRWQSVPTRRDIAELEEVVA